MSDNHYYTMPAQSGFCSGGNGIFDIVVLILLFGLMGGNGGVFGGNGSAATANETADMITQRTTADRVASIGTGVEAVAGLVTAQGAKLETVKDAVVQGFFAEQTQMCQLGNNLNNAIRDNREASAREFCALQHQAQLDKCEILGAIRTDGEATRALINSIEVGKLKDENLALKGQLSQNAQTATIIERLGYCRPACSPCGTSCCDSYGAQIVGALQGISSQLVNLQTSVNKIPTTTAAA
ncbi:MAG: hypothetical protein IKW19_05940 [Akkermansia sp.]|nr:hypothetical protein [Akkermansia sp.]